MISGCMHKSKVCSQKYAWRKPVLRHNSEVNKYGASSATLLYNGCNCLKHKLQHLATVQLFTTQQLNQHWIHNCLRRSALPAASSETVQQQRDGSFTLLSILSSLYLAGKLAKDLYKCMRRYVTRNALRYSSVQSGGLDTVLQKKRPGSKAPHRGVLASDSLDGRTIVAHGRLSSVFCGSAL